MKRTQYFKWGLTAFLTVCAVLVFYDTFYQGGTLQGFLSQLASILSPVLYGFAIAYLLTPVMSWLENNIALLWKRCFKKELKRPSGALRLISILLTEAAVLFLLYLLMSVLIPQLVDSVTTLINNAESYYRNVYRWADSLLDSDNEIAVWIASLITDRYSDGMVFLTEKILPWVQKAVVPLTNGIWSGIRGAVGFAFDLIVGLIVSIYLMGMKEKSLARCCKAVYACLSEKKADAVMRGTRRVNAIFSGFVRGKLLDSLIIGILCFICCSLLKLPYTPLVSVVVGVTNVIPFFGPFLGAIPSAFLILLVSPKQCLVFVVFIIVLQQFDGNILGPKILGDATGISSFWVIVAILVGGGFGGVLGMFIGVPVFACVQELVKYLMDRRLRARNMPTEAYAYVGRAKDDPASELSTESRNPHD
jgi:predicted PurR-regulated permease PerM